MKQEDFDRLKAVCEKEGFDYSEFSFDEIAFKVALIALDASIKAKKKDIWDGVYYCRNKYTGICGPINQIDTLKYENGKYVFRDHNEPITQDEYESYLKKEAFEKYGLIQEGDRFDRTNVDKNWDSVWYVSGLDFNYDKDLDRLYIGNLAIYQAGKWATKLPKRIEVNLSQHHWTGEPSGGYNFNFKFRVKNGGENTDMNKAGNLLASQLEKYLNGEIE